MPPRSARIARQQGAPTSWTSPRQAAAPACPARDRGVTPRRRCAPGARRCARQVPLPPSRARGLAAQMLEFGREVVIRLHAHHRCNACAGIQMSSPASPVGPGMVLVYLSGAETVHASSATAVSSQIPSKSGPILPHRSAAGPEWHMARPYDRRDGNYTAHVRNSSRPGIAGPAQAARTGHVAPHA